jgi:hypothetical protein
MGEISMSGSTREREAAVIGLWAFHSVLSSLLCWFQLLLLVSTADSKVFLKSQLHRVGGLRDLCVKESSSGASRFPTNTKGATFWEGCAR